MGFLGGGAPTIPAIPAIPAAPPAAAPATLASAQVASTAANSRQRALSAAGQGFANTIGTTPQGLSTPPKTGETTLLGATK